MTEQERGKRPVFLLVLCILSLVWIGLSTLGGLGNLVSGPESPENMAKTLTEIDASIGQMKSEGMHGFASFTEQLKGIAIIGNRKFYPVQITNLLIYALGIFSVLSMLRGNKLGFHLYIVYSLLSISYWYFFYPLSVIPTVLVVTSFIMSGIFVAMYAANLKWMR